MNFRTARAAASVRRFVTRAHSAVSPVEKQRRIQAINGIAAEVKREQSQTDNPEESARSVIKKLDNYSTKTIMCIRDGLTGTGKMHQFINYHDYVTNEEQLRVAVHYKDSGIINAFSICMTLKGGSGCRGAQLHQAAPTRHL